MNDNMRAKAYARRLFGDAIKAVNEMYDLVREDVTAPVAAKLEELRHEACANLAEIEYDHMMLLKNTD